MRRHQANCKSCLTPVQRATVTAAAAIAVCSGAVGAPAGPPDSAAIFEEAETSELRVLFATDFEEATPPQWVQTYAGVNAPSKTTFLGVTDEEARSGTHSFKIQVRFAADGETPCAYFCLPFDIPRWSEIKARFYIKLEGPDKTWQHHGLFGGIVRNKWRNMNISGVRTGTDNGWENPCFAMAWPTWSGKPIDTIIYEAFREGIYDTRYLATLQKHLQQAQAQAAAPELVARVETWLDTFSVHDDLQQVRRQMADWTIALSDTLQ